MHKVNRYNNNYQRRKVRVRGKISNSTKPRLAVFRSNKYIFGQIVMPDGQAKFGTRGKNPEEVGKTIASKAVAGGLTEVVFDRGGYRYHGQIKKLAEAAREGGLKF